MTVLQRLLKYPHAAVFDKRPGAEPAFRLQHQDGATWSVSDGVMVASAGGDEFTYALSGLTVAGLCAELVGTGSNSDIAGSNEGEVIGRCAREVVGKVVMKGNIWCAGMANSLPDKRVRGEVKQISRGG